MLKITDQEFKQLTAYIKQNFGIHLQAEKKTMLTGRLQSLLLSKNFTRFSEYIDYLLNDKSGEARMELVEKITTNHTFFMREADHFFFFRDHVLPELVQNNQEQDLRIWCAACSTGEEAYTLAMIIADYFGADKGRWDTRILATDISQQVLETARKGIYSLERIAPLPAAWRNKYFHKLDGENAVLSSSIKNEVIFRKFNLMEPVFPFRRKFQVIFCRNVMIYFDWETKTELVNKFYEHLEEGRLPVCGAFRISEQGKTKFEYIRPAVYRKSNA